MTKYFCERLWSSLYIDPHEVDRPAVVSLWNVCFNLQKQMTVDSQNYWHEYSLLLNILKGMTSINYEFVFKHTELDDYKEEAAPTLTENFTCRSA